MGGTQYYMLDVLLIVWIYQIFLGTVSSSRQSSIVIKSIQKLSYISSARILRIQVLQPWQLMCWDGTRGAAPLLRCSHFQQNFTGIFRRITFLSTPHCAQPSSYFPNSSFLWGKRKRGSRLKYSELPATVKIPGFQRATPFVKWHRDVRGRKIIEQTVLLSEARSQERQEAKRGSPGAPHSAPRTAAPLLPPSLPLSQFYIDIHIYVYSVYICTSRGGITAKKWSLTAKRDWKPQLRCLCISTLCFEQFQGQKSACIFPDSNTK